MDLRIVFGAMVVASGVVFVGQMKAGGAFTPDLPTVELADTGPVIAVPTSGSLIDIAVSRLGLVSSGTADDFAYYGTANGIRAFSMASTACNVGTATAQWISGNSGNHPLIAQNMYRYLDGRFEQIGMSWLKHSFCAVNENTCGVCQGTSCSTLGIGCADTYWATLNDTTSGGPRNQINPLGFGNGGTHTDPHVFPNGPTAIKGRLQIHDSDIVAGGDNFAEVHYITHDEPYDSRFNNASWREVNLTQTSITGVGVGQGSVHFQEPAIMGWQDKDPGVTITAVDDLNRGRFHLGHRVTDNGDGTWHYEYALHNMNSLRAAGSFSIPVSCGVNATNIGFHDVDYHSGDGEGGVTQDGTDWPGAESAGALTWATTESYSENTNANALRWGTLYNFRFDADAPPVAVAATIGLFLPGNPSQLSAPTLGPAGGQSCIWDCGNFDCHVGIEDMFALFSQWLQAGGSCDFNGGVVDITDLFEMFGNWGACP